MAPRTKGETTNQNELQGYPKTDKTEQSTSRTTKQQLETTSKPDSSEGKNKKVAQTNQQQKNPCVESEKTSTISSTKQQHANQRRKPGDRRYLGPAKRIARH